jgi:hypothetical protein
MARVPPENPQYVLMPYAPHPARSIDSERKALDRVILAEFAEPILCPLAQMLNEDAVAVRAVDFLPLHRFKVA